ncbi:MAG: PKD domain-containing protein [Bacteroidota bacterium]
MKKIRVLLCCFLLMGHFITVGQNFSNKGKDFWLGYGYHVNMAGNPAGGGTQDMILYFTSNKNANVTVEIPANGYKQTYTVAANQVTVSSPLPKSGAQDSRIVDTGLYNRGIHVYSDVDIVAYAHIYNGSVSGASLLFPTNTLGKDYYVIDYNQSSNAASANSFAFVVAVEDNTAVEITPSVANKNNRGTSPFIITLNTGQVYNLMGTTSGNLGTDLTGTRIRTISAGSTCKKIAVFCGAGKMSIGGNAGGSADNLFAQSLPASAWGLKYLTSPTTSQPSNYYRICVKDPATKVYVNGNLLAASLLQRNFFYELKNSTALTIPGNGQSVANTPAGVWNLIESDKPINVAQFCTTVGQDGNPNTFGDPEMIYLSPVEQTINDITLYSATRAAIQVNYVNVIIKKGGINSFTLDGVSKTSSFLPHPRDPAYYYASLPVASGSHRLYSDTGFNAIAYGFGSAESYGYNAGTNIKDLYTPIFQNPYARLSFAATCVNTPFQFSVPLSYQPTSLSWDFGSSGNISPASTLTFATPQADSTPVIGGQSLYYYSPSNGNGSKTFTYSKAGTDTIKMYASNPSPDGCANINAEYDIPVVISEIPRANFSVDPIRCISSPISFTDSSYNLGTSTIVNGLWDWNDGKTDSLKNPSHTFPVPKIYQVRYRPISDFGCIGDTTIAVDISAAPVARFVLTDSTCIGKTLTFIDSSSIATGTIVKWYWDYGDGSSDTLTTNTSRTKTYNIVGAYTVSLTVENNTGCKSIAFTKTITIHPSPEPNFNLPVVCLPAGTANFIDSTTISDGSGNFRYAWDFGDGKGVDSISNPVYHYQAAGPFTVKLTVTSQNGCVQTATKTLASVYAQAKANFTVNSENCLRDSTRFTDQSIGSGNTVTKWNWDLGDGNTDTATNPVYLYATAGTKTVKLFVFTDKGCSSDTITKPVLVNPLPVASFMISSPLCEARALTFTDQSKANAGTLVRWNWNFKDSTTKDTANGAAFTKAFTTWGNYDVRLMVETDKGCKSDTTISPAKINPLPKVGFMLPEICVSDGSATFTDTSKIADGSQSQFTWKWKILPGTNFNAQPTFLDASVQNAKVLVNKADTYQTLLKITSNNGCTDSLIQVLTVNGPTPKANFVIPVTNTLCSNDSIRIVNTSTVDFGYLTRLDIVWDLINAPTSKIPDETPVDQKSYSFKYADFQAPATVNYSVKLTAFSGNSSTCQNSITKIVTLNQSPKVSFVKPRDICDDASARLIIPQASTVSSVPGIPVYIGKGITNSVTGLFDPAVSDTGKHTIKYLHISDKGCRDSIIQSITVWPSPIAKWSISAPDCEKNQVTFTDSSLALFSNIAKRIWDFGDGTTQTFTSSNAFTHVYASANTYNASLKIITDSNCVSQVNTQSVKINYLPKVDFVLPSVCLPDGRAEFINTSSIADGSEALFSYLWNFNDPNDPSASVIKTPTHKYAALGPYNVKLIITTKDGCVDSVTKAFTTIYPQPKADFTSIPTKVCMGDTIRFMDNSNGITSPANTWSWDLAGGVTSVLQNPLKKFNDSGIFNIKLYFFNGQGCVSDTVTKQVIVYPYPKLNLGPDLKVLEGGELTIKPLYYYGTSLSFLWMPSLYLDSINIATPKTTPLDDITYKLYLTGIGGCTVSDEIFVKVLRSPDVPNAFSPNGDGIHDTWHIQYLESYPGATIEVFNRYGQRVFYSTGYDVEWDGNVNGKPLPVGTYYYIVDPKNGRKRVSGSVTIIK